MDKPKSLISLHPISQPKMAPDIDTCLGDALDEARRFLSEPQPLPAASRSSASAKPRSSQCSSEVARRLFALSRPLKGTIAETYLVRRGIVARRDDLALRFHPRCSYRDVEFKPLPCPTLQDAAEFIERPLDHGTGRERGPSTRRASCVYCVKGHMAGSSIIDRFLNTYATLRGRPAFSAVLTRGYEFCAGTRPTRSRAQSASRPALGSEHSLQQCWLPLEPQAAA